jgi:acyl dehydratase
VTDEFLKVAEPIRDFYEWRNKAGEALLRLDRVRFIAPVKAGARIRNRVMLLAAEPQDKGRFFPTFQNAVEIEGGTKPALIAQTLALLIPEE